MHEMTCPRKVYYGNTSNHLIQMYVEAKMYKVFIR